jgi:ammonium transporter, Amt family
VAQAVGSFSICAATLIVSFALMCAVRATGTLRVSEKGEIEGLDLHEHGMVAYPEYVIHGYDPSPRAVGDAASEPSMATVRQPQPVRAQ